MLSDFTGADKVYIACGYTDLRRGIDGLATIVRQQFELDPFTNTLFLFCGRRRDRIKGLYLKKKWPYLIRVLEDGRLELSNNLAERSIKPFVIGRKNFLFANTPWGAQVSAVIYSMIETAKESGLDPYRYLTWLLTNAPILVTRDDSWADKFLPANAPADCHSLQQNS